MGDNWQLELIDTQYPDPCMADCKVIREAISALDGLMLRELVGSFAEFAEADQQQAA